MAPTRFLVTSRGNTATKWIARVLTGHPWIYCNHSAGTDILERDYTPSEYAEVVENKCFTRDEVSVADFFAELVSAGNARIYGNVHRYSLQSLRLNLERFPFQEELSIANLVRHPVPWVESGAAQISTMAQSVHVTRWQLLQHFIEHREIYRDLASDADLLAWETLAFFVVCWRMEPWADEARDQEVRHFRMEDITTDAKVFGEFVEHLTGIPVSDDARYLERSLGRGPVHRHLRSGAGGVDGIWAAWAPWQQRVFRYWVDRSAIGEAFARFGYVLPTG